MRRIPGLVLVVLLAMVPTGGCRPSLSEEEFGTLLFEVPDVPGSEEPYELPPPVAAAGAASKPDSPAGESAEKSK